MQGLVIRNTGSWYTLLADDGTTWEAKVKGNFRLRGIRSTSPVAIGDRVDFEPVALSQSPSSPVPQGEAVEASSVPSGSATGKSALITAIHDRKNYIIRKATNLSKQSHILAANVDQCMLIVTLRQPETTTTFIDRFLASAEAYNVPVILVFNKTDLLTSPDDQELLRAFTHLYTTVGYRCLAISAATGQGLPELRALLQGNITLLSGNSGVGKSTLINTLIPHLHLRTSDISDAYNTGKHTTTFSEMYPLENSFIIDTPGIKGFGTFNMEPEEVGHYFKEIFRYAADCRFHNCTHTHEPHCAVLAALDRHDIALSRYTSYLSMLNDKAEGKYRPPQGAH